MRDEPIAGAAVRTDYRAIPENLSNDNSTYNSIYDENRPKNRSVRYVFYLLDLQKPNEPTVGGLTNPYPPKLAIEIEFRKHPWPNQR